MTDLYAQKHCSIIGVEEIDPAESRKYGIVDANMTPQDRTCPISGIVEKPMPEDAPSRMAVVGRYVLTPRIFGLLTKVTPGAGGEIQLTDAISMLLEYETVLAYQYEGNRYDCGSKLGYLQASVELGLKHPEVMDEFRAYLKGLKIN